MSSLKTRLPLVYRPKSEATSEVTNVPKAEPKIRFRAPKFETDVKIRDCGYELPPIWIRQHFETRSCTLESVSSFETWKWFWAADLGNFSDISSCHRFSPWMKDKRSKFSMQGSIWLLIMLTSFHKKCTASFMVRLNTFQPPLVRAWMCLTWCHCSSRLSAKSRT